MFAITRIIKKKAEPRYGSSADIDAPLATRLPLIRSVAFRPCLTAGLALSWNLIFLIYVTYSIIGGAFTSNFSDFQ